MCVGYGNARAGPFAQRAFCNAHHSLYPDVSIYRILYIFYCVYQCHIHSVHIDVIIRHLALHIHSFPHHHGHMNPAVLREDRSGKLHDHDCLLSTCLLILSPLSCIFRRKRLPRDEHEWNSCIIADPFAARAALHLL